MAQQNIFTVKIGGQAGQGIKSAGLMLAKLASRSGYQIYTYTEYPSLIPGGHNVVQVMIYPEAVTAPTRYANLLVALNQETIEQHFEELIPGSGIIFDKEVELDLSKLGRQINLFPVPLTKLLKQSGGGELSVNIVALGAVTALLGGGWDILKELVGEEFKGQETTAQAGFDFVSKNFAAKLQKILPPLPDPSRKMVINGNEAIALGAIAGGL